MAQHKQVHNVRLRVIDHDREHIHRLLQLFLELAGIERKQATITYSNDGEAEDPLHVGELWLDRQQPARKTVKALQERLPSEERESLARQPEKYLDTGTHCFLLLDKHALVGSELRFGSSPANSAQVRLNIAAFPATRQNSMQILQQLFG
jgi:RNA binding exosome subunit